ncbi:hypothetical protein [Burkholderia ubonensis]|uniref:hypothetical protein n=1 Tax=Burkholderia ubonensis TaxID=101571 RepID=UPI00075D1351|nr:hypothetical protein [Burkholderia ubonensis]KVP17230.1 hypothetical protein WJ84_02820 [Burkholderia ubonensis]
MQTIRAILFAVLLSLGLSASAQSMRQYVIANDVEIQYIRGEMRFCERENLKGITCGFQQNLFGKKRFAARDWWSPETYVQARTGLNEFTLWDVQPTADGRGIIIYFSE